MASRKRPQRVGQTLEKWIRRQHLRPEMERCEIALRWPELVGPRVAAHTAPWRLHDGTLTVTVSNSVWLNELTFLRRELIGGINGRLGAKRVSKVRFVVGTVKPRPRRETVSGDLPQCSAQAVAEARRLAEGEVPVMGYPGLRESIVEARIAQLLRDSATTSSGAPPKSSPGREVEAATATPSSRGPNRGSPPDDG